MFPNKNIQALIFAIFFTSQFANAQRCFELKLIKGNGKCFSFLLKNISGNDRQLKYFPDRKNGKGVVISGYINKSDTLFINLGFDNKVASAHDLKDFFYQDSVTLKSEIRDKQEITYSVRILREHKKKFHWIEFEFPGCENHFLRL